MASDLIERLTKERDEAQSACTAWQGIYEGLEAHLMDRVNMGDEANPEAYLSILRGYVADIIRDSRAICNARWADYGRHEAALAIERERAEKAERRLAATEANAELRLQRLTEANNRIEEELLPALAEARRLLDWQTMESAPRDGTIVNVLGRYVCASAGFPRYAGYEAETGRWMEYTRHQPEPLTVWAWRPREDWPDESARFLAQEEARPTEEPQR